VEVDMKIMISEEVIEESLATSADTAVKNAFDSYDVRRVLEQRIGEEVIGGAFSSALTKAIDQMDIDQITQSLAKEISRTVVASTVTLLRSQAVEMIYRLRGHGDYDQDKEFIKLKIADELRREAAS
jgi:hypothetical protein